MFYSFVSRALVSVVLLALLALYPLAQMNLWGFWLVIALCSYFIYWHLADVMLLRRRAYLGYVTQADSYWRQRLWNSWWVRVLTGLMAVVVAFGAIGAAARLSWPEWVVLGASVCSFQLIQRLLLPFSQKHIQDEHRASVIMRLSHGLNMVLVVLAMLAVHLWVTEVPDTRHLHVADVMVQAYQVESATAKLQVSGWLLGVNAALYSLFWHVVQLLASGAPWWISISLWLVVMCGIAIQVALIWLVLLGSYAWLRQLAKRYPGKQKKKGKSTVTSESQTSQTQSSYLIALVLATGGWLAVELTPQSLPALLQGSGQPVSVAEDPCSESRIAEYQANFAEQSSDLRENRENAVLDALYDDIDRIVDKAYLHADTAVNAFLDWNFSMPGQYTQLLYLMRGSFTEAQFNQLMADKIDEFMQQTMLSPLSDAENQLQQYMLSRIGQQAEEFQADLERASIAIQRDQVCIRLPPLQFDLPELMHKSGVGAGAAPGLLLMSRALAPGSAVAARSGTRRMFAAVFTRMSARAGSSAAAASAGSVCGPGCMLILGSVAWVGTDLIINYGDEMINRQGMYDVLMAGMNEQRDQLKAQLKEDAEILISGVFYELEMQQQARFNLYRELSNSTSTLR